MKNSASMGKTSQQVLNMKNGSTIMFEYSAAVEGIRQDVWESSPAARTWVNISDIDVWVEVPHMGNDRDRGNDRER